MFKTIKEDISQLKKDSYDLAKRISPLDTDFNYSPYSSYNYIGTKYRKCLVNQVKELQDKNEVIWKLLLELASLNGYKIVKEEAKEAEWIIVQI